MTGLFVGVGIVAFIVAYVTVFAGGVYLMKKFLDGWL